MNMTNVMNVMINLKNDEWYVRNIPRVSNIVSFVFPFDWNSKQRYLDWLNKLWITEEEYLWWANELWTYIHKQMENIIKGDKIDIKSPFYKEVKDIINNWKEYIKKLKKDWYKLLTEVYLKDKLNRYQWTTDLVLIKNNEIIIADWKSYWVVKRRYNLINKSTLDSDKREKVRLQLSLYAYAMLDSNSSYRCSKVKLLYLHDDLIREYEMDLIPRSEIEKIINDYIKTTENYYITF